MADDFLTDRLRDLCSRMDSFEGRKDALRGRYVVAKRAKVNEQYLYQILTGKPTNSGEARGIGKRLREKISQAFPDWLDTDHSTKQHSTGLAVESAEEKLIMMINAELTGMSRLELVEFYTNLLKRKSAQPTAGPQQVKLPKASGHQ